MARMSLEKAGAQGGVSGHCVTGPPNLHLPSSSIASDKISTCLEVLNLGHNQLEIRGLEVFLAVTRLQKWVMVAESGRI